VSGKPDITLVPTDDLIRELATRSKALVLIRERFSKPTELPLTVITASQASIYPDTTGICLQLIEWAQERIQERM